MRRFSLVVVGFVVLGIVSLASVGIAGTEEDVAAISKVRDMEVACLNEADPSLAASFLAAEVAYVPPGEAPLASPAAVQDWMAAMLDEFDGHIEYTLTDIKVHGDWAYEHYAAKVTLTPKAGGEPTIEHARGIHIYHRGEDGGWKITHDVWNYAEAHESD